MALPSHISSLVRALSEKVEHDLHCLKTEVNSLISLKIDSMRDRHEQIHHQLTPALLEALNGRDGSSNWQHDLGQACDFEQMSKFDTNNLASVMFPKPDDACKDSSETLACKFVSNDSHKKHGEAIQSPPHDLAEAPNKRNLTTEAPPINLVQAQVGPVKFAAEHDRLKSTFKHSYNMGDMVGAFAEMVLPEEHKAHHKKLPCRGDPFSVVPGDMFERTYMDIEPYAAATAPELPVVNWDQRKHIATLRQSDLPLRSPENSANHESGLKHKVAISLTPAHKFSNLDLEQGNRQAKEAQETNKHGDSFPRRPPVDPRTAKRPARRKQLLLAATACRTDSALPDMELHGLSASSQVQKLRTEYLPAQDPNSSWKQNDHADCKTPDVDMCPITALCALPVLHSDLNEDWNTSTRRDLTLPGPSSNTTDCDTHIGNN